MQLEESTFLSSDYTTKLQSSNSVVLAQRQKYKSMEQNRKTRDKSMHLWIPCLLVRQEPTESLAAFLERLMETFRQYTPMDPQAEESHAAVLLAFVNQAAPDIRKNLQKIEGLGKQMIQDLLKAAEKIFNNRETPEEREE